MWATGALDEVVGVVLHERGTLPPSPSRRARGPRSPVPSALKPQPASVSAGRWELTEPTEVQSWSHAPRAFEEAVISFRGRRSAATCPIPTQLSQRVALAVFGHEGVDMAPVHGVDDGDEVADRPR